MAFHRKRSATQVFRDFLDNLGRQAAVTALALDPQGDPALTTDTPREWDGTIAGLAVLEAKERAMALGTIFEQVYQQAWDLADHGGNCYLVDIYIEEGNLYALMTEQGKFYRSPVLIQGSSATLGDAKEPVMVEYVPLPEEETDRSVAQVRPRSRMTMRRTKDGKVRWLSQSCTAIVNRVGQIDSTQLFDSFVAHAERTGEYPIRQFYHAGENWRTGQADWMGRDGYVFMTSGIFDDTPIAQAEVAARSKDPDYWGESIGFDVTAEPLMLEVAGGVMIPMYVEGICREISTLPEAHAASLYTRTHQEVKRMRTKLSQTQWDALVLLFDGDVVAAEAALAAAGADETNRAILEGHMVARSQGQDQAGTETTAATTETVARAYSVKQDGEKWCVFNGEEKGECYDSEGAANEAKDALAGTEKTEETTEERQADQGEAEDLDQDQEGEDGGEFILDDETVGVIAQRVLAAPEMQQMFANFEAMRETTRLMSETASGVHQSIENSFAVLDERMEALEEDEEVKRTQYQNDLGRRRPTAVTYRASRAHGNRAEDEGVIDMQAGAEETLASLP